MHADSCNLMYGAKLLCVLDHASQPFVFLKVGCCFTDRALSPQLCLYRSVEPESTPLFGRWAMESGWCFQWPEPAACAAAPERRTIASPTDTSVFCNLVPVEASIMSEAASNPAEPAKVCMMCLDPAPRRTANTRTDQKSDSRLSHACIDVRG